MQRECVFCRAAFTLSRQPWLCDPCAEKAWPPAGAAPIVKRKAKKK